MVHPVKSKPIPVIDIFSGPGGLSEGFSAAGQEIGNHFFRVNLSIEKDQAAHSTLELRCFFREFQRGKAPEEYYAFLRGEITRTELFEKYPFEASQVQKKVWKAELGGNQISEKDLDRRIRGAIGSSKEWVLLGGPPCQAYSVAGRSRNKGVKGYRPEEDHRHFLYQEYLKILGKFWPPVFVMENVKGIISSRVNGDFILQKIFNDLSDPCKALNVREKCGRANRKSHRYLIYSLVKPVKFSDNTGSPNFNPTDYVVQSEHFGIPQTRHRLILLGVRDDTDGIEPSVLSREPEVPSGKVLEGLPRLRSGLSREEDTPEHWRAVLKDSRNHMWLNYTCKRANNELYELMLKVIEGLNLPRNDRGEEFISYRPDIGYAHEWYLDPKLEGVCNSTTKAHMKSDLYRYLYAACYAKIHKVSPRLANFPIGLLPNHNNLFMSFGHDNFSDRFRVQIESRPSTTITSHLSKDGHYFIHPDPSQCRSLTVREAARLQSFPDNYFFCGGRTPQFVQVGNAVPPLLAKKIALVVQNIFKRKY
jgi:DNA (cytosine-5)-methyltransferase 1